MLLNLREVIGVPGGKIDFDYFPDLSEAINESMLMIKESPSAVGNITNKAGVLTFSADVNALCVCVCGRCLAEFEHPIHQQITAYLTESGEDGGNPDGYYLQGDEIDVSEIIVTEFILELEEKALCRAECKGLCGSCGCDLNSRQCSCKVEIDPRLEILAKLLDD